MFKTAKKIFGLFLVLLMAVSLITSCGSSRKPDKEIQELGVKAPQNLAPVTLTIVLRGEAKPYTEDILKEIGRRTRDVLNIELNFKYISENWLSDYGLYEKQLSYNKGYIGSDGFYMFKYKYDPKFNFADFARQGYLVDISKLFPKYAPGIYKKLSKEQLAAATVDGKLYAVPGLFPKQQNIYAVVREDLVEKYNIPEIKTYGDYEAYMKTIKENESGITSPCVLRKKQNTLNLFADILGYEVLNEDLQLVYKQDDPDMKVLAWEQTPGFDKASGYLLGWLRKGYLTWSDVPEDAPMRLMDAKAIKDWMLSGEAASSITFENSADELNSQISLSGHKDWKFKAYRLYPDLKQRWTSPVDGCIVFQKGSENVDRALMFLDWVQSSQENYDLLMYGRENKDYSLEGKNYKLPKGFKSEYECPYLGWASSDAFKNPEFERLPAGTPESAKEEYLKAVKKITYPPHLGFYPDLLNLSSEVNSRKYYLDTLYTSPVRDGIFSKKDLDPDLCSMSNEVTRTITTAVQGQINEWEKNKK